MCAVVNESVHVCAGAVVLYIGAMWYISVKHTLSPAVIVAFCCRSPFAPGSFDAFLIPVVTMEIPSSAALSKAGAWQGPRGDSS